MKASRLIMGFILMPGLIGLASGLLPPASVLAAKARPPAWSGKFYPDDPAVLEKTIRAFCAKASKTPFKPPKGAQSLKALILPHAGYMYSGLTAAHASLALKNHHFKKIVLIGPDHRVGFSGASVTGFSSWNTPLGTVPVHPDARRLLAEKPGRFKSVTASDLEEHSLEVLVPFFQILSPGFQLVPVTFGRDDPASFARDLQTVIPLAREKDTLLVVSSDLSHFLPLEKAVKKDRETLDLIVRLHGDSLATKDNAACGILPILSLIHLARQCGWQPVLIDRSTSFDGGGDKDRVVGYAAIAFYGGDTMTEKSGSKDGSFTESQGRVLVDLARKTIADRLGVNAGEVTIPKDPVFSSRRGTFVTLKIDHELRGCIGNLGPDEKVVDGIRRNAINAAFNDFRFSPLTRDELDKIDIEVSILTEPRPLAHEGGADLLSKLRPHVDGVIIRQGGAGATFLPQVWEQLPDPREFMEHLCRKAGLSKDAWKSRNLGVSTYQVQYFEER